MRSFVYPAMLTPDEQDGGFVVTFPDVPEAITQGEDVSDALQQAADCLEGGHRGSYPPPGVSSRCIAGTAEQLSGSTARANCRQGGAVPGHPAGRA